MAEKTRTWVWRDEQPGAVIFVALIICLLLFFPREGCQADAGFEASAPSVQTNDH